MGGMVDIATPPFVKVRRKNQVYDPKDEAGYANGYKKQVEFIERIQQNIGKDHGRYSTRSAQASVRCIFSVSAVGGQQGNKKRGNIQQ